MKANEISRIREKNVRIAKIISQLKLDDTLVQPEMSVLEDPEKLLVVDNSEILVEKYVSPEETKRLEEVAKAEQEKLLAAMGDNPRERALDMMMGGRLEANVEEDLFKVCVVHARMQARYSKCCFVCLFVCLFVCCSGSFSSRLHVKGSC